MATLADQKKAVSAGVIPSGTVTAYAADEPLQNEFFVRHRGSPRDRLQKLSV